MTIAEPKPQDPTIRRLGAWLRLRCPPLAIFCAPLYLSAALVARAGTGGARPNLADILGPLAVFAMYVVVQAIDEHVDAELDRRYKPERLVPRGVVRLDELKVLGGAAFLGALAITLVRERGAGVVTLAFLGLWAWNAFRLKSFFAPGFFGRHLVLRDLGHLLILVFAGAWFMGLATGGSPPIARLVAYLPALYLTGFVFAVARKLRAPGDEHPELETFTGRLGVRGAAILLASLLAATACAMGLLVGPLLPPLALALVVPLLVASAAGPALVLRRFVRAPGARTALASEIAGNVGVLSMHWTVAIALAAVAFL